MRCEVLTNYPDLPSTIIICIILHCPLSYTLLVDNKDNRQDTLHTSSYEFTSEGRVLRATASQSTWSLHSTSLPPLSSPSCVTLKSSPFSISASACVIVITSPSRPLDRRNHRRQDRPGGGGRGEGKAREVYVCDTIE